MTVQTVLIILVVLALLIGAGFLGYYLYKKYKYPTSPFSLFGASASGSQNPGSCAPPNGAWSIPGAGLQGRSRLASPCCQPPDYALYDPNYKTCDNIDAETDPTIKACLQEACKFCEVEKGNMDPSWYPMCKCGAALCCYNAKVPHFDKYGTCVHYIEGDIAEAETPDTGDYIGFGPF